VTVRPAAARIEVTTSRHRFYIGPREMKIKLDATKVPVKRPKKCNEVPMMKRHFLLIALALGTLVFSGRTCIAQQLSSSAPIIIQLAEIDRFEVSFWPEAKVLDGAMLGLPFGNMKESEVETLVKAGVFQLRPIWIMDGQKVIAVCCVVGEFLSTNDRAEIKYGFLLGFASAEPAEKLYTVLRQERNVNDLISIYKSRLDDRRFWQ